MAWQRLTVTGAPTIVQSMFSGIVEETAKIARAEAVVQGRLVRIWVERPKAFNDLSIGDSVATDGVCLTVEAFDEKTIQFAIAAETLAITTWRQAAERGASSLVGRKVNLERSLRFGDRIHGHLVAGHVDAAAKVVRAEGMPSQGLEGVPAIHDSIFIDVEIPKSLRAMVWKKGSWALNGVSLTVNSVEGGVATHCLIPETLHRTNLGSLKVGDLVNVEVDVFSRSLAQSVESYMEQREPKT